MVFRRGASVAGRRRVGGAVVVTAMALGFAAVPAASAADATATVRPAAVATKITGFPLIKATVSKGARWNVTLRVTGPVGRAVILQQQSGKRIVVVAIAKTGRGGVVTFSVKNPKAGKYRIAVPKKGTFKAAQTDWRTLAVKAVAPPAAPTWPTSLTGPFSGTYKLGEWVFTWSGQITYHYQENDPVLNRPWMDSVHYAVIGGSFTWNVTTSPSATSGCTYTGSGSVTIDENETTTKGTAQIAFDRDADNPALGWNWQASAFAVGVPAGKLLPVTVDCPNPDYPVPDPNPRRITVSDFNSHAGAGDGGALVQTGYFHKDYTTDKKSFARTIDVTNDAIPGYLQHWQVSLTGAGAVTPPYWRPCSATVVVLCH